MTATAEPAPTALDGIVYTSDIPHLPDGYLGVEVFVEGDPAPQGSKNYVRNPKTGKTHGFEASKKLKPWRGEVTNTLLCQPRGVRAQWPYPKAAITVGLEFVRPRPKSFPKSRTPECIGKPDGDKLIRAVYDGISDAGVWHDDSNATTKHVHKRYAELGETPGCRIVIIPAGLAFVQAINPDVLEHIKIG